MILTLQQLIDKSIKDENITLDEEEFEQFDVPNDQMWLLDGDVIECLQITDNVCSLVFEGGEGIIDFDDLSEEIEVQIFVEQKG